jgi:hypothetical protein
MRNLQTLIMLVLLSTLFGCSTKTENKVQNLFTPNESSLANLEMTDDAKVAIVKDSKGSNTLQFSCEGKNQAPSVIVHDKALLWRLNRNNYLAADITNNGSVDALVEIRFDANGWSGQAIKVIPGQTRTVRVIIPHYSIPEYYKKKIIGLYNLPDGIIKTDQKIDSIHKLSFLVACPVKATSILISDIRAEGAVKFPTKEEIEHGFFPLMDEFGQYRHTDWPEKTHNLDELKKSAENEEADLASHPRSPEWDKYGGWLKGPQLKATGNFRTEKVDGKWWLVDPEGRLFWSHGMGSVALGGGSAVITDREFYFTDLPDLVKYKEFYGKRRSAPFGYYKDKKMISFDQIAWNMMRKYGDGWKEKVVNLVPKRLESWGQNTLGAWTTPDLYLKSTMPYTPIIMPSAKRIEGSEGHWYKYTDPYDTSFVGNLTRKILAVGKSTTDPYCIGYYVDNEITWGDSTGVARWTIASPATQAAKIVMLSFLKKKYKNIKDLNAKWKTEFASWEDFMNSTKKIDIKNADTKDFTLMAINDYFKTIKETLQKLAPNKLYLGPRLDFHFYPSEVNLNDWDFRNNWIVNIADKYCDVVSFNRYRHTAADLRPGDFDKPIIVGEWHHVPLEKGSFYMSAEHFNESLKMRAEKYEYFVNSCLNNPYIVGAHYFQFLDQPTVGRGDGENFSCGFLNICDRPHEDMVNVSRKIGKEFYQTRYSGK